MTVVAFEITGRAAYAGGRTFGDVGAYERIDAIAHYAVDPFLPSNAPITDLGLVTRDQHGAVRFSGDVTVLLPVEPGRGNRGLLVEVPNRGHRIALRQLNLAPVDLEATARMDPGDGYLFRAGWTVAWCGWQWDVPRSDARIGLEPPYVEPAAELEGSRMQLRIQPNQHCAELVLTDQHVGAIGQHRPIQPADIDNRASVLMVRDSMYGEAQIIPREAWRFARGENAEPDPEYVWLRGGFSAGRIYDFVYQPARCPVAGAGLLAVRDLGAYLRRHPDAPTAGRVEHTVAEGVSQCGRFLRTFLYYGMNRDEEGQAVYDGMLIHVAGGRRGEFNHRYAQPSVQPTPSFGHQFPFADAPQADPHSEKNEGLLDRLAETDCLPRIVYTDTSSEYWRGDASLAHSRASDGADLDLPGHVVRYLFASAQHGPGVLPFSDESPFGSQGANCFNVVDYRPLYRNALANLLRWLADGELPPRSVFPRYADQGAANRETVLSQLASIPGLALPGLEQLPELFPLDLGSRASLGIGTHPARATGSAYPAMVSAINDDGNEIAGILSPDVSVPVATHTGFNPRRADTGGSGQLLEYLGSTIPFAVDEVARELAGDLRPSLEARYAGRDDYLAQVRDAADALVRARYLLAEDVATYLTIAAERYDAVVAAARG